MGGFLSLGLFLAELDLLDLDILAGAADDGLAAAVTLADIFFEVLGTFGGDNHP